MKVILTVRHKNDKTFLSNGKGNEWCMQGVDDETAIASLVFFTLKGRFMRMRDIADNFKIEVTLDEEFLDK
jgi:hypothetical protein